MKVNPISALDAASPGLWKKGPYDFEVVSAIEKQSKSGNDMTELAVKVYDAEGKSRIMNDWLVESPGMAYKTRHFAESTGLLKEYEKGELPTNDLPGKTGRCQLGIEKGKQIPGSEDFYPDKNKIQDYLPRTGKLIASVDTTDLDDEVPF